MPKKHITTKELIALLKKFPDETQVVLYVKSNKHDAQGFLKIIGFGDIPDKHGKTIGFFLQGCIDDLAGVNADDVEVLWQ